MLERDSQPQHGIDELTLLILLLIIWILRAYALYFLLLTSSSMHSTSVLYILSKIYTLATSSQYTSRIYIIRSYTTRVCICIMSSYNNNNIIYIMSITFYELVLRE